MKKTAFLLFIAHLVSACLHAQDFVTDKNEAGSFPVVSASGVAPVFVDSSDHWLVQKSAWLLRNDIQLVAGKRPDSLSSLPPSGRVIIIGSIDKSPLIRRLVKERKLSVKGITGKWEAFTIQVVEQPLKGIEQALVIAGSDRRGTAFGVFELSRQMGVSPWYWWADVPVQHKDAVYVTKGAHQYNSPAVKYRGIFINDEAPAFSGWTKEKFGGVNHLVYEKVFELLLRMKGNYLWPAMWGNAFNDDDTLNPVLADQYGIVMGTSHHEPMLRAQQEWKRYGSGAWNYETNEKNLKDFWRKGIRNMGKHESIVTIGMRGDGDEPMTQGTAIALLEKIVKDQRAILKEVTGKDPAQTPQLWALYKEVQEYYDKGMRVPDDVTLLLCDDNWGNIRKLPKPGEKRRAGGYGIYYHFDYVGGPRNYKWLNTNLIPRIWEQMHLAYRYKADQIWIVNVGDLKPMELPIQFFLDYAWNPEKLPADRLDEWTLQWAEKQFGSGHAAAIAGIVTKYTRYNARRKPELLSPETYSLTDYREAETVVADYKALVAEAEKINNDLPPAYRDAYYQLVLHPVQASSNLNELYVTVAKNRLYAAQGRAGANELADSARALFVRDSAISYYYNKIMAGGKWNHMMDQTHIGYTYWQHPPNNTMPLVKTISLPDSAAMGIAIEGSDKWWPNEQATATLPEMDLYGQSSCYIDVFNRGQLSFDYTATANADWLTITPAQGKLAKTQRLWLTADWKKAPSGKQSIPVTITGPHNSRVTVQVSINNPAAPKQDKVRGFVESNGYVSIEADHFTNAVNTRSISWQRIPNIGRTGSGMTPFPVTAPAESPGGKSPRLEYHLNLAGSGAVKVQTYWSPTLNFNNNEGLRYGISFDEEAPRIINLHADKSERAWNQSVADNIRILASQHNLAAPGEHVLKVWMVDPGVVLQKIVVDLGGVKRSYLGPPESFHQDATSNQR